MSQQPVVLGVKTAESHAADGIVPPEEQSVQRQTLFSALMCHLLLLYRKHTRHLINLPRPGWLSRLKISLWCPSFTFFCCL